MARSSIRTISSLTVLLQPQRANSSRGRCCWDNHFRPYQNLTPNYTTTYPEAGLTFVYPYQQIFNPGIALGAIDPNIKQPYTESWNLSIQRPIGRNNVIEFRYIGSHSVHQWLNVFTDEVNIFGGNGNPGFLPQFQQAQKNLAINTANGNPNSFANNGFAGQARDAHL